MILRKFLSQRTVMPYSATPPKPAMARSSSGSCSSEMSLIGSKGDSVAERIDARNRGIERLDLQAVDADHGVAVVHQVVRDGEARGPQADDQNSFSGRRSWVRAPQVERIPAREQRIDLEAPRQLEHVLQRARLGLRDVDRLLLLVDAGLHAVVADAVAGGRRHRVVDRDDAERGERLAARLHHLELGDLLLERAAGERHAEHGLLERPRRAPSPSGPSSRSPCPARGTRCSSWPRRARRRGRCRGR